MKKESITIEIDCSGGCGKPLIISKSHYQSKKAWGRKNFYHNTRECLPKAKSLGNSPKKSTIGGIYPEYWKSK